MRYNKIENQLFINNRNKLNELLKNNSLVIINSNNTFHRNGDQDFTYRQNSDLFYLTGVNQEESILWICPNHNIPKYREILFVKKSDKYTEIWYGKKYTKDEIKSISGIETVMWLEEFDNILHSSKNEFKNIYLQIEDKKQNFVDDSLLMKNKQVFKNKKNNDINSLITSLRLIKEPQEIELIQKSCDITEKAFIDVLKFVKPNVYEYEIEAEMTHQFMKSGCNGHAYAPIVASGKSACVLHYGENDKLCKDGDLILMDFGAEYANYAADCSRTIPVNGKFTIRQKECYNAVLRVFKKSRKLFVIGTTINKINKKVVKYMEEEMIKLDLFTEKDVEKQDSTNPMYFKYYMHGVSHFMGLDVHDVGDRDVKLKKGMILTCEPGLYIEKESIGIRIEDDLLIWDNEPIDLLQNIPFEVEDIERLMLR